MGGIDQNSMLRFFREEGLAKMEKTELDRKCGLWLVKPIVHDKT